MTFNIGDIVNHPTFGYGIVEEISTIENRVYAKLLLFKRYEHPIISVFKDSVQVAVMNLTRITT
jgi:hypothetical protein